MAIYKNKKKFLIANPNKNTFGDLAKYEPELSYEEMKTYIESMDGDQIRVTRVGNDLIVNFPPFSHGALKYIEKNQGDRETEVFIRLIRFYGRNMNPKFNSLREDPSGGTFYERAGGEPPLDYWTFPLIPKNEDDRKIISAFDPFYKITPEEAASGEFIWTDGYIYIDRLKGRPFIASKRKSRREIAFIIGLANQGMNLGYNIYKKGASFYYWQ